MPWVSAGYAEGSFSIDVTSALRQGANSFSFFIFDVWGYVSVEWIEIDGTLTITADSVVIPTPPTPPNTITEIEIIAVAIAIIVIVAVVGVRLR
jgi:hypothetical protein